MGSYSFCYNNHPVSVTWNSKEASIYIDLYNVCGAFPICGYGKNVYYMFEPCGTNKYCLVKARLGWGSSAPDGWKTRPLDPSEYDLKLLNTVRDYLINKYRITLEYSNTTPVKDQKPVKEQKPDITESTPQKSNSLLWLLAGAIVILLLMNKR